MLMLLFPNQIMGIFGKQFINGSNLLQILSVGQFINVATGAVSYLLMMSGFEKDLRNIVVLSGILSLCVTFSLTKFYGIVGAAYATTCTVLLQNLLAVGMVKKRLGFNMLAFWK